MASFNSFAVFNEGPTASSVATIWPPNQNVLTQSGIVAGYVSAPLTAVELPQLTSDFSLPPAITFAAPVEGTVISRVQTLGFDVVANANVQTLSRVVITLLRGGEAVEEMVHDGVSFSSTFDGGSNTRQDILFGYRYTILRLGGWHGPSVTIRIIAVDTYGNVAQKTVGDPRVLYTWPVAVG